MAADVLDPSQIPPRPVDRGEVTHSAFVLALGAAIVGFLFWYINQGRAIWSFGGMPHTRTWDEYLLVNTIVLMGLPLALGVSVWRRQASDYGVAPALAGGGKIALLLFAGMLPLLIGASRMGDFRSYYPMQPAAISSWGFFLYHEISYGFYMLAWEFFYRGYLTFGLEKGLGRWAAILLPTLLFAALHWGKPMPEFAGSFVAGAALGWLALRSRSFLPCFWLHWAVSIAFDVLAIHGRPGAIF